MVVFSKMKFHEIVEGEKRETVDMFTIAKGEVILFDVFMGSAFGH